jgi:hypothetical protein
MSDLHTRPFVQDGVAGEHAHSVCTKNAEWTCMGSSDDSVHAAAHI